MMARYGLCYSAAHKSGGALHIPTCKRGSAEVRPELMLGTRSHSPGRAPWVSMCTGCAHAVSGLGSRFYMHDVRDCTLVTLPLQS